MVVALLDAHDFWVPSVDDEKTNCAGTEAFLPNASSLGLCVRGSGSFNQYDSERMLLNRWLSYPFACNATLSAKNWSTDAAACLRRADLVVAATPIHDYLAHPERLQQGKLGSPRAPDGAHRRPLSLKETYVWMRSNFRLHSVMSRTMARWWERLLHLGSKWRRPRILAHWSHPFDATTGYFLLSGLYRNTPGWFQRRVVITCFESNLPTRVRKRVTHLNATILTLPLTTSVVRRPAHLAESSTGRPRVNRLLFSGR